MEKIFANFEQPKMRPNPEAGATISGSRSRPVRPVGGKIINMAPVMVAASIVATLGYATASYVTGRHSVERRYASRNTTTRPPVVAAKRHLLDFVLLTEKPKPNADLVTRQAAPQRQSRTAEQDGTQHPTLTSRQVEERETAAEKLRREYAEDAAITRRLNTDALNAVSHPSAQPRRPIAPSTPDTSGDG